MNSESHYLHRVEQPDYFRATPDLFEPCVHCGNAIIPGDVIAECPEGDFIHATCLEAAWEN